MRSTYKEYDHAKNSIILWNIRELYSFLTKWEFMELLDPFNIYGLTT